MLACHAPQVGVERPGFLRLPAHAHFKQAGRSFHVRLTHGNTIQGRGQFSLEFMIPCHTDEAFHFFLELVVVPDAKSRAQGIGIVEANIFTGIRRQIVAVHLCPQDLAIDIDIARLTHRDLVADPAMCPVIPDTGIECGTCAHIIRAVIRPDLATPERSLDIELVVEIMTCNHTGTKIFGIAVPLDVHGREAVIGIVIAIARFDENTGVDRADGGFLMRGNATHCLDPIRLDMAASLDFLTGALHGKEDFRPFLFDNRQLVTETGYQIATLHHGCQACNLAFRIGLTVSVGSFADQNQLPCNILCIKSQRRQRWLASNDQIILGRTLIENGRFLAVVRYRPCRIVDQDDFFPITQMCNRTSCGNIDVRTFRIDG